MSAQYQPPDNEIQARRCGFVALIGAPNAGKSTLINQLVGTKVSIVTHKVQTTRSIIRGVVIDGASQIVLIDTPGIFKPRRRLDRAMVNTAWGGAHDSDLVAGLIDARKGLSDDCATTVCLVPTIPGWAPNAAARPGVPLTVAKSGVADLALAWGRSCSGDAVDSTVHAGTIGTWYSHEAVACDTAGAMTSVTLTPASGGRYFLAVPVTDTDEGSYGLDSAGTERPPSMTATCVAVQTLGCP